MPRPSLLDRARRAESLTVLRIPDFRRFLTARFCMTLGMQMQSVLLGWQVYDITRSELALGYAGLAEAIPAITFALVGGHYVDKNERRGVILGALLVNLLCTGTFLTLSFYMAELTAAKTVWPILMAIFVMGMARAFLGPGNASFLAQLVPRELYPRSSAWNSTFWQTASVTGPAVGGLLYGFAGPIAAYTTVAVLILLAILFLLRIPRKPLPVREGPREPFLQSLSTGMRFVFSNQTLLGALVLDLFAVLFGGAVALLPVFAREVLHVGPEGLGMLRAAPALGAVGVALILAFRPLGHNAGRALLLAVAGFGLCMIGFAYSTVFWWSLLLLLLSGAFDGVSVVIRSTILQMHTPDHMRGRVASVNTMFISSSNEIGQFESGLTAHWWGATRAVAVGGMLTLAVVGLAAWRFPILRRLSLRTSAS